jgi:hypothetical protein
LAIASAVLWVGSLPASPGAATGFLTISPYPDSWFLYAQSGTLVLGWQRTLLSRDEVGPIKPTIDRRALLGFGTERQQQMHNWPVQKGTVTYGTDFKAYFCPLWSCVLLFLLLPLLELPRMIRNLQRLRGGLCLNCGYDLRASPNKCPECGAAVKKTEIKKVPLPAPR